MVGNITASGGDAGGLVGIGYGTLDACVNSMIGNINGTNSGGIIGRDFSKFRICGIKNNCCYEWKCF